MRRGTATRRARRGRRGGSGARAAHSAGLAADDIELLRAHQTKNKKKKTSKQFDSLKCRVRLIRKKRRETNAESRIWAWSGCVCVCWGEGGGTNVEQCLGLANNVEGRRQAIRIALDVQDDLAVHENSIIECA